MPDILAPEITSISGILLTAVSELCTELCTTSIAHGVSAYIDKDMMCVHMHVGIAVTTIIMCTCLPVRSLGQFPASSVTCWSQYYVPKAVLVLPTLINEQGHEQSMSDIVCRIYVAVQGYTWHQGLELRCCL